jgi:hypothetical protein
MHTPNIHALSGIGTHDHSVQASEDSSCLRPRGYCDPPAILLHIISFKKLIVINSQLFWNWSSLGRLITLSATTSVLN